MKELIAALAVLVDPNASDEEKTAALGKLTAHFNAELEKEQGVGEAAPPPPAPPPEAAAAAVEATESEPDKTAATPYDSSKEMTSALAQVAALTERVSKMEKASAIGNAPRAQKPTVLPRTEPPAQKDPFVSMIETAGQNTLRNLSK